MSSGIKVFDQFGGTSTADAEVILNDLSKAPILTAMPDGKVYLAVIIPSESNTPRIGMLDPSLVAKTQSIDDILNAVTNARQALVDQVTKTNLLQDMEIDQLVKMLAEIVLTPGPPGRQGITGRDGDPGLPGPPGSDGADGLPGKDGERGLQGPSGKDGANGKDGLPGANGKDGLPGKDGVNGTNGINGSNGLDGAPGKDGISPTLSVGTVSTVAAGGNATAGVRQIGTGTYAVDLGIPVGIKGATGTNGTNGVDGAKGADGIVPTYRGTLGGSAGANSLSSPALSVGINQIFADVVTDANGLWSLDYTAMAFVEVVSVIATPMGGTTVATSINTSVATKTNTKSTGIATKPVTLLALGITQVPANGVTIQLQIIGRK